MYSILIVDDEPAIRNGLKNVIDWEDLGIEIVGTASNGEEAMRLIKSLGPTIVLTDIRMPGMDGLELMKKIAGQYPDTKIAVLSGYDDFDYLRTAMRLGATNYLLKPVDERELISAMREIIVDLDTNTKEFLKYREFIQLLQKNTLNRVVIGDISLKELREKCELLEISFESEEMHIALIQMDIEESEEWKAFAALNICDEMVGLPKSCYIFPDSANRIVLLFQNQARPQVKQSLRGCIDKISELLETECVASVGMPASSYREIPSSYDNAVKLLNYQLIYGRNHIFSGDEIPEAVQQRRSLPELFEKIMPYIEACNRQGLADYIDTIFKGFSISSYGISPENIKFEVIHLISYILNSVAPLRLSPYYLQHVREDMYNKLQETTTSEQLKRLLMDFSFELIAQIETIRQNQYSLPVKQVADYICEKYNDDNISLKTLGDTLSINPAYLGRIFKQETGEFFSDYLTNIRVMKAKELLLTTNRKTNEIAEAVGFSSTSYFYTAFKKVTGQKPSEVRK